jgi:hypothetical protein
MNPEQSVDGDVLAPSTVGQFAAAHEIRQAIARAETCARRLRYTLRGEAWTCRNSDAEILELEIIPALRRALIHLPNDQGDSQPPDKKL